MVQHRPTVRPTENTNKYALIRSYQPYGSQTILWAENLATRQMYYLLQWGNMIYLPVDVGDHVGIGVYNGSATWQAYPLYVEALNIWENGQNEPENCDVNHMWEVAPFSQMTIDALMNPNAQVGRPFIVTRSGEGLAIGESTFGTTAYRGQIRVYERNEMHFVRPFERHGYGANPPPMYDTDFARGAEAHALGSESVQTRGASRSRPIASPEIPQKHAAIGAGDEESRPHQETGMLYQTHAQSLVNLQVEFRHDLRPMLNRAWGKNWDWFWPTPHNPSWWSEPWAWTSPRQRTSDQVPVVQPHTGRGRTVRS